MRVLRLPEVIERTGRQKSAIYKEMALGIFPKPIRLGAKSRGWVEAEIDEWISARIAERDRDLAPPIRRARGRPRKTDRERVRLAD